MRAYLTSGVLMNGIVVDRDEGTPQGGPLSPLLANVMLDEVDKWMRHRMRAIQLKHWKRAQTIYSELLARKASPDVAAQVAVNARRWWRNSGMLLNSVLTLAWADRLGIPRLC